ncbi:S-adenosyl-L-methionine-dependent methyltransferase [Ceratobasidium sp. AG-I]|nr:S-adenosyl-L-methionine-dependent methyltransferase [Ceratobasidium sp. AG-I]
MAAPHYDPDTEGYVYHVQQDYDDELDRDDSDMQTISSASTSRTTSTITSDEINEYFREAHGRVYPVDENLPLTYPVDDIETRRHQLQHIFVKALVHGNYIGPVKDLLKPRADGSRPRILDIRTCAGDWAQEMAEEFPHCDITSIDIAPITTHVPRANIAFEVYDLYAGVAEPDESFDYVSCRHVQLAVKEYDRLIFDLHRVLRSGGLITVCEVENLLFEVDQPPYNTPAYQSVPNTARAIDFVRTAVTNQGIDINAIYHVHEWLEPNSRFWTETAEKYEIPLARAQIASEGFRDVQWQQVLMPTGTWHPDPNVQQVGSIITRTWILAWKQLEPLLIEGCGLTPEEAHKVASSAIEELEHPETPILAKYRMIYGTKI